MQYIDLFSTWIFVWFILFFINKILIYSLPYGAWIKPLPNPLLALYIGLFENIITLIILLYNKVDKITILKFCIINILFKMIPIFLLYDIKINYYNDLLNILSLFILYNIYLYINNKTVYNIYYKVIKSLVNDENITPSFYLLKKIFNI